MSTPTSYPPTTRPRHAATRGRRGPSIPALVAGLALALMMSGSVLAGAEPMRWHRLNVHGDPAEHERFGCIAGEVWRCRYDKLPEPTMGLAWDQTHGTFSGTDTTSEWTCPWWFPADACADADTVVSGVGVFFPPRHGDPDAFDQQLLVADDGDLWIYWTDLFVCPWYPTFDEALVSESSCSFAP